MNTVVKQDGWDTAKLRKAVDAVSLWADQTSTSMQNFATQVANAAASWDTANITITGNYYTSGVVGGNYYTVGGAVPAGTAPLLPPDPALAVPADTPAYRRPPRGFNRYVNASDLLEDFIRFAGTEGVRQGEVLGLPLELFLKWLIIRACEEDQEEPEVTLELPCRVQPRCLGCQRYMARATVLPLHGERCAGYYFGRGRGLPAAA